jgi:hypothetical protein
MSTLRSVAVFAVVVCAFCSSTPSASSSTASVLAAPVPIQVPALTRRDLTPAEVKYGKAATRDTNVVYAPEVVIIDRGPEAIRSVSADGLTWTIDARAPHASELAVGKIAFITVRGVGRVLQASRDGDVLHLVLGPVDLTDVFRKLDATFSESIDLDQGLQYPAPQYAGLSMPIEGDAAALPAWSAEISPGPPALSAGAPWSPQGARIIPAGFVQQQQGPVSPGIPQRLDMKFQTKEALSNAEGIGAEMKYSKNGIVLKAQVQLLVEKPKLDFHVTINEKDVDATVILRNVGGLRLAFDAAAGADFAGSTDWYLPDVGDISVPIGTLPLSVTLRQDIWVRSAFTSKQSAFSAGGEYTLNADFGFTSHNGGVKIVGPKGLTVKQSLMNNIFGISLSPVGMTVSHEAKITAGVGTWGFTTGPTLHIGTSLQVRKGSSIGIVPCLGAALSMNVKGSVGYSIPGTIQDYVDDFLKVIHAPPLPKTLAETAWANLFSQEVKTDSAICKGKDEPWP